MHTEHDIRFLSYLPLFDQLPNHVGMTLLVIFVLMILTYIAKRQLLKVLKSPGQGLLPEEKLTYRNFFEIVAESLLKLTESVLGHQESALYYPVVGSLFLFIFASNLIGLVPGFHPATDNLNKTLALGFFVFISYNFVGFKKNGLGYFKHFLGPLLWLSPLMLVIEIASHIFRPLSLALRLRGNIMGDHIVLGVFSDLVPILLPVIFYGLGVFVAFVQAFVFCLMTMVYISLSASHDH